MGAATFWQQGYALLRKSFCYQRRAHASNTALVIGPIFFCVLLTLLQLLTNKVLLARDDLKCGCQCTACCKNGVCTSLTTGYCDEFRGYKCVSTNASACGVQYSSPQQAVWCPIPEPSIWPPVVRLPRPRFLAKPFGPFNATPLMYTRDAGPGARSTFTAGPAVPADTPLWVPPAYPSGVPGNSSMPPDVADYAAAQIMQLPSVEQNPQQVLSILRGLTNEDMTVFNGHLLSLLGLQFANARQMPQQYYLDSAFINSGSDLDLDTLMLLMPNNSCAQRNMSFTKASKVNADAPLSQGYGTSAANSSFNTYNLTSFFYAFYPGLQGLVAASGFDMSQLDRNPLLSSVRVACVDVPLWRLPNQEAVDLTLWCGFKNGYPIPPAQCPKTSSTPWGTVESYFAGWNYLNTTNTGLALDIQFNLTFPLRRRDQLYRMPGLVNLGVRGWLRANLPPEASQGTELLGLMSMPKPSDKLRLDFSSLLGPLFYTWVLQLLMPTMLQQLVYEKERRLRMMMKMHGLGDTAYWFITYVWNMLLYIIHTAVFLAAGSILNLQYFRRNSYGIQIILYLLFGQLQLAFIFMLSAFFSSSRTATVVGYLYILATGLIGFLLLENLMDYNKWWLWIVELLPAFSLYRGLYELGTYAFYAVYRNSDGMRWSDLNAQGNGMVTAWIIMAAEWPIFMLLALYLEQVIPTGNGTPRHPLFFLRWIWQRPGKHMHHNPLAETYDHDVDNTSAPAWRRWVRNHGKQHQARAAAAGTSAAAVETAAGTGLAVSRSDRSSSSGTGSSHVAAGSGKLVVVDMHGLAKQPAEEDESGVTSHMLSPDVQDEQQWVDRLWTQLTGGTANVATPVSGSSSGGSDASSGGHGVGGAVPPILCHHLRKEFSLGLSSKAMRVAVRDLSLAVTEGECFGLLGPNGAGKTSTINMLTGLLTPSGGSAIISGHNIRSDMPHIYKLMGVCPQHNLLWDQLTAREHLRFYGRLKGLQGDDLEHAVVEALKAVNLLNAGVGDKQAGKYSGGMKRRLSVAISFIGSPKVVYLDEPSTGLDPASRRNLWEVVKSSKRGRSIILTTHSMEEAEQLCDRLGIFVDGQLVCIGAPKEITSRYAGFYVFTISVPVVQESEARALVQRLSPNAVLTYALGGTLKYELPSAEVSLSGVFKAVNEAKAHGLSIIDWGVANATLEEVFIKLARKLGNTRRLD